MEPLKKAVIIGAGQTGRGFVAPFVMESGWELVFLDRDPVLIEALNRQGSYTVAYCGNEKPSLMIGGYRAYTLTTQQAIEEAAAASAVITAVGESNLKTLVPFLRRTIQERQRLQIENPLLLVTCENGVQVKGNFVELEEDAVITEGIIFCTTLKPDKDSLNLLSESYPDIPYDGEVAGAMLPIQGFKPIQRFSDLIQRKIYTYNCLSACIAYLGYYQGYESYGEAANDPNIITVMEGLSLPLNQALSRLYQIPEEEQQTFCRLAIKKFQNRDIVDTIARNTRDVNRKLGTEERLIKPLRILLSCEKETKYLELTIGAALYYGEDTKTLAKDPLLNLSQIGDLSRIKNRIEAIQNCFIKKIALEDVIRKVDGV